MKENGDGAKKDKVQGPRERAQGRKRRPAAEKRLEQLKSRLTEELFDIALGQSGPGGENGQAVGIKERLKAAELLAKYSEGGEAGAGAAAPAVIIDDID